MSRPLAPDDLALLINILAACEGEIWGGNVDALADHMLESWKRRGLLSADATHRDVRQILADLNQRVRYAKGEYDEPPTSAPVGA